MRINPHFIVRHLYVAFCKNKDLFSVILLVYAQYMKKVQSPVVKSNSQRCIEQL